ncbi:hypothetical protein FA95DRAFT_222885 [Auriscalpium vulgare]|uniref:Uncharacterized protein n=1 Tax=Auriscalpium vulgare TaxID=40419 RepID=A0ACB8RM03_9AGAM|nr:hypothetical protein FA95DRAFT_222885 [Auriscalpium vulgare]
MSGCADAGLRVNPVECIRKTRKGDVARGEAGRRSFDRNPVPNKITYAVAATDARAYVYVALVVHRRTQALPRRDTRWVYFDTYPLGVTYIGGRRASGAQEFDIENVNMLLGGEKLRYSVLNIALTGQLLRVTVRFLDSNLAPTLASGAVPHYMRVYEAVRSSTQRPCRRLLRTTSSLICELSVLCGRAPRIGSPN